MVQGFFLVMSEDLGIFLGLEFCLHSIIPVIYKSEYPPWDVKEHASSRRYRFTENYSKEYFIDTRYSKLVAAYKIVNVILKFICQSSEKGRN